MKLAIIIVIVLYELSFTISETTQFGKKYKKIRSHKTILNPILTKDLNNPEPLLSSNEPQKKEENDISSITTQIKKIVESDQKANDQNIADIPIYLQGWVKYIHYRDNLNGDKPKSFFKNEAFTEQRLSPEELSKKDSIGYLNIPSDKNFWFTVLKDTVNILSSRKNVLFKTIDVLNIEFIKAIPETKKFSGGVQDFGSFNEGQCFQVKTIVPFELYEMTIKSAAPINGANEVWIFCLETLDQKEKFMSTLIELKLKKQHVLGHYFETKDVLDYQKDLDASSKTAEININSSNLKPTDGYWVLIQDWTQCTLKCGGGLQYQQNACIPPKEGGKPCEGLPIRTRPCNTNPCPTVKTSTLNTNLFTQKGDKLNLKPIVKAMRVSTRPVRYDKCHLKEGDGMMSKVSKEALDQGFSDIVEQYPVRMVMNEKTLLIYTDDSYSAIVNSFLLSDTKFIRLLSKKNCFKLVSNNRAVEICEIEGQKSFVDEWDYDFNLFKIQCKKERPEIQLEKSEEKKLEDNYKEKVAEAKADVVRDRQTALKKEVENTEEAVLEKKVMSTQTTSIQAIKKELKLEEKLEREEKEREELETREIAQQILVEKKKNDCLLKVIKQKEIEDQFNLAKEETEKEIISIKNEAKKDINIKRNEMKEKILAMRKKNERKKNLLKQQLMAVRTEMASNLENATKQGSMETCKKAKVTQSNVDAYCEYNFNDNFAKLADCKDISSFCYVCCENEYGDIFVSEREICYSMCDKKEEAPSVEDGKWHWEPEINK